MANSNGNTRNELQENLMANSNGNNRNKLQENLMANSNGNIRNELQENLMANSNGNIRNNSNQFQETLPINENINSTEVENYNSSIFNQKVNNKRNNNNGKINLKNLFNQENSKEENNSSKSIFSTIGETLGLTVPIAKNNINKIKTNLKSDCEGEDCDIFSNNSQLTKINTKFGNSFNNPETRFNNARKKFNNLLGNQILYSKRNKNGKLTNIPQTGDIHTYLEKT